MILMLGKQNNLAEVLPVQMESREKWSVNICLCSLCERWRFNWLHKHRVILARLSTKQLSIWVGEKKVLFAKIQTFKKKKNHSLLEKKTDVNMKE